MDRHVTFTPQGVCSRQIDFDLVDGYVHNLRFTGGCRGNTSGLASLVEGMQAQEVIYRLKGTDCRGGNSCPHQLALALEEAVTQDGK